MKPFLKTYNFFSTKHLTPATIQSSRMMVLFAQFINPFERRPKKLSWNYFVKLARKGTIWCNRLEEKLQSKNVISQELVWFRQNFRTTDQITNFFTLLKNTTRGLIFIHLLCRFLQNIWFYLERRFDAKIRKDRDYSKAFEGGYDNESPSVSLIYKEIIYKIVPNECRTDVKGYLKHNIF